MRRLLAVPLLLPLLITGCGDDDEGSQAMPGETVTVTAEPEEADEASVDDLCELWREALDTGHAGDVYELAQAALAQDDDVARLVFMTAAGGILVETTSGLRGDIQDVLDARAANRFAASEADRLCP